MKAWWRETWTRNLFWDSASLAHSVLSDQSFGRDKEAPCNSGTREALKLMILKGYLVTFCLYSNPWLTAADFLESLCIGQWLASGELTVSMLMYLLHLTHFPAHTSWEDGIFFFFKKKKQSGVCSEYLIFPTSCICSRSSSVVMSLSLSNDMMKKWPPLPLNAPRKI